MKKKIIIAICILVMLVLLVPIPIRMKDGGTIKYQALLYSVSDVHRLAPSKEVDKVVEKNGRGVKNVKYHFVNRFKWSNPHVYWGYDTIL